MQIEDLRAKYGHFTTPSFSVSVGGEEFTEADELVSDLLVETVLDGADRFSFDLEHPFDYESWEFSELDWDLFTPGTSVEIAMGYVDRREPLFVGTTNTVQPSFPAVEPPTVHVSGYGLLHGMMRGTKSRSWDETTDSDVVEDVVSAYRYKEVDVEDTGVKHRKVIQDEENDYRFLLKRAEKNGFELFARRDVFRFRTPDYDSEPAAILQYRNSIGSFSLELNDADQVTEVEVRHWDPTIKKEIVGTATKDGVGTGKEVLRVPVRSIEEANEAAESALLRISEGLVRGEGETVGIPEMQAGEVVQLKDLGERFSRAYYVERATHWMESNTYTTSFEIKERSI